MPLNANSVLILGNGTSRLQHMDFIQNWKGEIWGCNSVYKEFVNGIIPRLNAITGDKVALKEALRIKNENKFTYTVWSRSPRTHELPGTENINLNSDYVYDSGTTLVCKALIDGYEKIYLVGFDLGGKDIYVPEHNLRNKSSWVVRWRKIAKEFGLDRITFVGVDHKSYILSQKPSDAYAKVYMKSENHLTYDYTAIEVISNDVMILGNGISRQEYNDVIRNWKKELWVCNGAYVESVQNKYGITRVSSVHPHMVCEAYDFKVKHKLNYALFCTIPVEGLSGKHYIFLEKRGWCSGALSVCQAILEDFDRIYLLGFDFGGADIYQDHKVTGDNFKKQFMEMKRLYPSFKKKIIFMGGNSDFLGLKKI